MYSSPPYKKSREVNNKNSQQRRSLFPSMVENQWRVKKNWNPKDLNDKEPEASRTNLSLTQGNMAQTTLVDNHVLVQKRSWKMYTKLPCSISDFQTQQSCRRRRTLLLGDAKGQMAETAAAIIAATYTQTLWEYPLLLNPIMMISSPSDNSILFLNPEQGISPQVLDLLIQLN